MPIDGLVLVPGDRIKETTGTTGTGAYDLDGASAGFRTFAAAVGDGGKSPYVALFGSDWEVGIGTVAAGATNTLSRDEILASSNSGAVIDWSAGTKDIWQDIPAAWFAKVAPWGAQFQPAADGTNVVVVKDASGNDRAVLRIAPDGSANINARDASGVERARLLGGSGRVEGLNAAGNVTTALDGSGGTIDADGDITAGGNIDAVGSITADGSINGADVLINGASVQPALAKAWAKFGNNAGLTDSYNVSSITDNGTGDWSVNWATHFSNSNYVVIPSLLLASFDVKMCAVRVQNAGAARILCFSTTAIGEANVSHIYVVAYGSQ